MLLPLRSERLGQYDANLQKISEKPAIWVGVLIYQISFKNIFIIIFC